MDYNAYKTYLKDKFLSRVRPLQQVNNVISEFQKKIDLVKTELTESESTFLKITTLNYAHSHNIEPSKLSLEVSEFSFYEVVKNKKSEHYYSMMEEVTHNKRIIILTEPNLNEITSNCQELKVDMLIERGIESSHIKEETPDFFAYLMLFDV